MQPFAFHVSAANYRRRPSVRLAPTLAGNPFDRARMYRVSVRLVMFMGGVVAGQLLTLHLVGAL